MKFNFEKSKKPKTKDVIGTIDPNSAEMRKETPEIRKERARSEAESGVKANIYKDRSKYDRKTKHKGKSFE